MQFNTKVRQELTSRGGATDDVKGSVKFVYMYVHCVRDCITLYLSTYIVLFSH